MLPGQSRLSRSRITQRASIAVLVGTLACGDDPLAPACDGPVDVSVSGSLPPVIRWSPDCSVERLSAITPPSMGFVHSWTITAGEKRIESGVRLGQAPSGTVEQAPLGIIMSGVSLSITLESPRGTIVGGTVWTAP